MSRRCMVRHLCTKHITPLTQRSLDSTSSCTTGAGQGLPKALPQIFVNGFIALDNMQNHYHDTQIWTVSNAALCFLSLTNLALYISVHVQLYKSVGDMCQISPSDSSPLAPILVERFPKPKHRTTKRSSYFNSTLLIRTPVHIRPTSSRT